ncbi:hypothetical protein CVT26_010077 [Gymnopilus dilepis]|uniref:Hypervirulence associated protein TUDOR domain-containing protein n=1 Tax=Gymnopilus dilepis TaxID=231916 RepID=A0A409VWL8_9AGAR|nr:hypothetical protein CVT26_010077 [Gymnopilus dilepis]
MPPKNNNPFFATGDKVVVNTTHTTKSQIVVWKGTKGKIEVVHTSQSMPGVHFYNVKLPNGTMIQGIEEEYLDDDVPAE